MHVWVMSVDTKQISSSVGARGIEYGSLLVIHAHFNVDHLYIATHTRGIIRALLLPGTQCGSLVIIHARFSVDHLYVATHTKAIAPH